MPNAAELYRRLEAIGLPEPFVRHVILPGWWDDVISENPAGHAEMCMWLSRRLGLDLAPLMIPGHPIAFMAPLGHRTGGRSPAAYFRKVLTPPVVGVVLDMRAVVDDPHTTPAERAAAEATIKDAIWPSGPLELPEGGD